MAHTIEKVKLLKPDPGAEAMPVLDSGRLVVDGNRIEFQGKKGTLEMSPVRDLVYDGNLTIHFGVGGDMRTALVSDFRRGSLKTRSQNKVLEEELRAHLELRSLSEVEQAALEQEKGLVAEALVKRGRKRMWIGGGVTVAGLIATVVSYSAASDSGGTYYIFWGAPIVGLVLLIQGVVDYRKNRDAAARVEKIPSGAGMDVGAMKAAGDVDGIMNALWVDELDMRVQAMDALAELNDGTIVERLTAKLGDPRWDVRWTAAEALGKLGDPGALPVLEEALNDPNALVRGVAEDSIKALKDPAT